MVSDGSTNMIFPLNVIRVRSFPENVATSGVHTAKTILKKVSEKAWKAWKATSEKGKQFRRLDLSKQRSRNILTMVCKH